MALPSSPSDARSSHGTQALRRWRVGAMLLRGAGMVRLPAALAVVLAVLVFSGLPHESQRDIAREIATNTFTLTPASAVRAVRAYFTNGDDMYRCHAYAHAMLGRPYRPYFVRTRSAWDANFARGLQEDPDATAVVHPARPLLPYRDFLVEYPPGFLLVMMPPALVASTPDGYALAFKLQMAACLVFVLLAVLQLAGRLGTPQRDRVSLPVMFAVALFALGVVATHRYDAFVAACMVWGVLHAARGRPTRAGLWLGLGIAAKGVPVVIVPLVAAYWYRQRGSQVVRFVLVTAATAAAPLMVAWTCLGGGVLEAFRYHFDRPVQIESTPGSVLALASALSPGLVDVVHSFSSRNLRGAVVETAGALSGAIAVASMAALLVWLVRRIVAAEGQRERLATVVDGITVLLAAYVTLGKVFCPQYLIWLLPFALLAACRSGRARARRFVGLACLVATQAIYPAGYAAVKALAPWASTLVLLRNLAVLIWAMTLLRRPRPAVVPETNPVTRSPARWDETAASSYAR